MDTPGLKAHGDTVAEPLGYTDDTVKVYEVDDDDWATSDNSKEVPK